MGTVLGLTAIDGISMSLGLLVLLVVLALVFTRG
jgi:hypothetical protein